MSRDIVTLVVLPSQTVPIPTESVAVMLNRIWLIDLAVVMLGVWLIIVGLVESTLKNLLTETFSLPTESVA